MKIGRHQTRALAMQVLFVWDAQANADPQLAQAALAEPDVSQEMRDGALAMATQAWQAREVADQTAERLAPQWPPRRQPGVDRAILRLAMWELSSTDTPPKVVIDEAIELAKEFSTENSPAFVNGILDAAMKQKLESGAAAPAPNP